MTFSNSFPVIVFWKTWNITWMVASKVSLFKLGLFQLVWNGLKSLQSCRDLSDFQVDACKGGLEMFRPDQIWLKRLAWGLRFLVVVWDVTNMSHNIGWRKECRGKALCTKWLWLASFLLSGLAWEWPETGLRVASLRVATYQEWLASVCGRPRERERAASARHRRVEARHGAGQRPPGQAIRGPLHNLKFSQPELLQTLHPSWCFILCTSWQTSWDRFCERTEENYIARDLIYQSLPWGAHHCKGATTYLMESIFS